MLESIKGSIIDIKEDALIVDVNGFGLEIFAPMRNENYKTGDKIFLYIYMSISQNGVDLYGFREKEERDLIKTIVKVPNVGPKTAFSLISGLGIKQIRKALANNDPEPISRVKGIGSKTAKRIILELKDSLELSPDKSFQEARKALMQLGFLSDEANRSITKILQNSGDLTSDEIVERVLKEL